MLQELLEAIMNGGDDVIVLRRNHDGSFTAEIPSEKIPFGKESIYCTENDVAEAVMRLGVELLTQRRKDVRGS